MRVLYDSLAFTEPFGGVSRYFVEVLRHLPQGIDFELAVVGTDNKYLQQPPFSIPAADMSILKFMPRVHFRGKSLVYRIFSRLAPNALPAIELKNAADFMRRLPDCDIVHLTAPHRYFDSWRRCVGRKPFIVTVPDLIPDILWKDKRISAQRSKVLQAASHVITISNHTRQDIVRRYGIADEKISVVYLGGMERTNQNLTPVFPGMKYILYVGQRGGYKNFMFFINALTSLLHDDPSLNLVCTGPSFADSELVLFSEKRISGQVHHLFVPDNAMTSLFAHASCFVYPSLYEGFGIPILDAFEAGCPVILSRCSCFPEIAGDAALFFDEGDGQGLRKCVEDVQSSISLRTELVEKGRHRGRQFSWDKCAAEHAAVYRKVLGRT